MSGKLNNQEEIFSMSYKGLSIMVKTGIATVVAGGILVTGMEWQGEGSFNSIKGNVDSLKVKLTQAIEDNDWLQGQFNSLKNLYNDAVDEANDTIKDSNYRREQLEAQVASLSKELQDKENQLQELLNNKLATEQGLKDAQIELQSEIDRLEAELDKANSQIEELKAYVDDANNIEYTALNKEDFKVIEKDILDEDTSVSDPVHHRDDSNHTCFVSREAKTLNHAQAMLMKKKSKDLETALGIDIVEVVVASNGELAYKVNSISETVLNDINTMASNEVLNVKNSITQNNLFFVDNSGLLRYINNIGLYLA